MATANPKPNVSRRVVIWPPSGTRIPCRCGHTAVVPFRPPGFSERPVAICPLQHVSHLTSTGKVIGSASEGPDHIFGHQTPLELFLRRQRPSVAIHASGNVSLELSRTEAGKVVARVLISGVPSNRVWKGLDFVNRVVRFVAKQERIRRRQKRRTK